MLRRAHDVGKHDRGHDTRWACAAPAACKELLDLVDDAVGVACPQQEVVPGQFDPSCPGDPVREITTVVHLIDTVTDPVHHERRNGDLGQQSTHIDRLRHLPEQEDGTRTRAETHEGRGPLKERPVAGHRWGDQLLPLRRSPVLPHEPAEVRPVLLRPTPGVVVAPACLGVSPAQDQAGNPFWMRDRSGDVGRSGVGVPETASRPRSRPRRAQTIGRPRALSSSGSPSVDRRGRDLVGP
jgi:hypothetical protein